VSSTGTTVPWKLDSSCPQYLPSPQKWFIKVCKIEILPYKIILKKEIKM
jgi:hypothetical protein